MVVHPGLECLGHLQVLRGRGHLPTWSQVMTSGHKYRHLVTSNGIWAQCNGRKWQQGLTGERERLLLLLAGAVHGHSALLPQVAGEADEINVPACSYKFVLYMAFVYTRRTRRFETWCCTMLFTQTQNMKSLLSPQTNHISCLLHVLNTSCFQPFAPSPLVALGCTYF